MNINSSSYYSPSTTKSSSNKGIPGLMSGMDTESMVEQMLSGTQGKIDKQEALMQQTLWKQEIYRDIITNVNSFYNKYFDSAFDSTLKNNFASASFFNSMISSVRSGDALKVVSTNSSALSGEMRVAVKQLAATASLQSDVNMSTGKKITGKALDVDKLTESFEKTVTMTVNGTSVKVDLNNVTTESGMVNAFNKAFEAAGFADDPNDPDDSGVTVKAVDGRLRFVTNNPDIDVRLDAENSTKLGLTATGLKSNSLVKIKDTDDKVIGNMLQGGTAQPEAGVTFAMTLDGVTKNITMNAMADASGNITEASVHAALQKEVRQAFGSYVDVNLETGADGKNYLELNVASGLGAGHELTITGVDADIIGITPGASNQVNTSTKLSELGLQGGRFSFKINDVEFTFDESQTLGTVINTVNNSKAGVKLSYSSMSDTFRMEATSSGSKFGIQLQQTEGNFLSKIFGSDKVSEGSSVAGKQLTTDTVQGARGGPGADYKTTGGSLSMMVNGKSYTFTLKAKEGLDALVPYTASDVESELNSWLKDKFGADAAGDANISYNMTDGQLKVNDGSLVSFTKTRVDMEDAEAVESAKTYDLGLALGFTQNAASNVATADTALSDIVEFKGMDMTRFKDQSGNVATKLGEIKQISGVAANDGGTIKAAEVSFSGGRLSLKGKGEIDFTSQGKMAAIFGSSLTLSDGGLGYKKNADGTPMVDGDGNPVGVVDAGKDAVVLINGVETTRSSNTFTVDGVTMQLTKVSASTDTDVDNDPNTPPVKVYEETVIGTSRDVESLVEGFKGLVEDYNAMLDKVNSYIYQDPDYRKYAPLTPAQRKEMSDSEVEAWEKKAKTGLVRHDDTVTGLMSSMRMTLYTKPVGAKFALYDIGVETSDGTKNGGKLKLNEAALRDALASDPDAVRQLFTDSAEGLSKQLMGAMDSVVKTKGATPGTLVQIAGMPNTTSEKSSSMYEKLTTIESRIKDLKKKYEKERARYWNQFNGMEKAMANFNSQSAMFSQQFSGY